MCVFLFAAGEVLIAVAYAGVNSPDIMQVCIYACIYVWVRVCVCEREREREREREKERERDKE